MWTKRTRFKYLDGTEEVLDLPVHLWVMRYIKMPIWPETPVRLSFDLDQKPIPAIRTRLFKRIEFDVGGGIDVGYIEVGAEE